MRMKIIALLGLSLLTSCGVKREELHFDSVHDPHIGEYIHEFTRIAKKCYGIEAEYHALSYGFNELERIRKEPGREGVVGVCLRTDSGKALIAVRHSYWVNATPAQRTILIFHEMKHCYTNDPDHINDRDHIMNSQLSINDNDFITNYQSYMDDLFGYPASCDLAYKKVEVPENIEVNPLTVSINY